MIEIALAVRVLVSLVFLTAAFGKARHRHAFQGVVANYRLLPEVAVPTLARLLPAVEAAVAAALLFTPSPWPEVCAGCLLAIFGSAMGVNLLRGRRHIDCGCFQSALKQTLSWTLVVRNVGLVLLLAIPAVVPEGALTAPAAAEAIVMGCVLFVLLHSMNVLWSVVPAWQKTRSVTVGAKK